MKPDIFKYLSLFVVILATLRSIDCQACQNTYGNNKLNGTCKSVQECTGAALIGDCSSQTMVCCVDDRTVQVAEHKKLTKRLFLKLVGNTTRNNAMYNYVVESMKLAAIEGKNEDFKIAAYLAQLVGETDYFRKLESGIIDGDEDQDLNDKKTYQGRGGILIRGKANYELANKSSAYNFGYNLVQNPERAAFPSVAFKLAAWFWKENAYVIKNNQPAQKGDLNQLADGTFHNFTLLTHALSNNLQNIKNRADFNDQVLDELKSSNMKRGQGVSCRIDQKPGIAVPICTLDFKRPYCGCEGEVDMRSCPYGLNADNRCRSSNFIKCCVEKCSAALDLVIVMDSSGSIGDKNFDTQRRFVKTLLSRLNLGKNGTLFSLINFNTRPYMEINFQNFTDYATTANIIDRIRYTGGFTYTFDALKMANEEVLREDKGMRPVEDGIPKVVMVLTDGLSNNKTRTLQEAQRIKDRGFNVISVGIGVDFDLDELIKMANTPNDQYFVDDFDKLELLLSGLSKTTCQKPAEVEQEKEIKSSVEKNAYKYYKVNLEKRKDLKKFSVELKELRGRSRLYHSFKEENPKSDDEFLSNSTQPDKDGNYVEKMYSLVRLAPAGLRITDNTLYYQIERPDGVANDWLYMSVKGLDDVNDFQVIVYNRTIDIPSSAPLNSFTSFYCVFFIQFLAFFLIFS